MGPYQRLHVPQKMDNKEKAALLSSNGSLHTFSDLRNLEGLSFIKESISAEDCMGHGHIFFHAYMHHHASPCQIQTIQKPNQTGKKIVAAHLMSKTSKRRRSEISAGFIYLLERTQSSRVWTTGPNCFPMKFHPRVGSSSIQGWIDGSKPST